MIPLPLSILGRVLYVVVVTEVMDAEPPLGLVAIVKPRPAKEVAVPLDALLPLAVHVLTAAL